MSINKERVKHIMFYPVCHIMDWNIIYQNTTQALKNELSLSADM